MRPRGLSVLIAVAGVIASCSDDARVVTSQVGTSTTTSAPVIAPATVDLTSVRAQIITAKTDVCGVVSAEDVQKSFHAPAPLATFPMGESSGPACGFADPREGVGGYVLVIQFQALSRWGAHAQSGKMVQGLGREAVLTGTASPQLMVLDTQRAAVVMFLAPDPSPIAVDALVGVAALAYGVPREGMRFGE